MANEVKVIGVTNRWFIDQWYAQSACQAGWHVGVKGLDKDTPDGIELVDKVDLTRLQDEHQGELAGAQAMLETAYCERDTLKAENEALRKRYLEDLDLFGKCQDREEKLYAEIESWRETAATYEDFYRKTEADLDKAITYIKSLRGVAHTRGGISLDADIDSFLQQVK